MSEDQQDQQEIGPAGEKLQKVLARIGVGSRRDVESWISQGRIKVNGKEATLGLRVDLHDAISIDGKVIKREEASESVRRVIMYNKPDGEICTRDDPEGRPTVFARARIYARDMDSVESLERWLNEQYIQTSSRLNEISNVKAINKVLGLIFGVVAGTALAGCMASLVGAFVANIDRKRKDLAVLRLLGFRSISIALYVLLQAWVLTTLAYAGGMAVYGAASVLFDKALGTAYASDGFSCHITLYHMGVALAAVWAVALIVSCIGALRAVSIQPAESLREL